LQRYDASNMVVASCTYYCLLSACANLNSPRHNEEPGGPGLSERWGSVRHYIINDEWGEEFGPARTLS